MFLFGAYVHAAYVILPQLLILILGYMIRTSYYRAYILYIDIANFIFIF